MQKEITTISTTPPGKVVQTTRKTSEQLVTEHPQKVFEEKKTIFKFDQIIWYITGVLEVLLGFRFVLKVIGANPFSGFTYFVYAITDPFVGPFQGILRSSISGVGILEWATIIALLVYLCIAWGLVYLLDLLYPITPEDMAAI